MIEHFGKMKTGVFPNISITLLLILSAACNLTVGPLPTSTKVNGENIGGQFRPSKTSISPEQTVEPIQPPRTPTATIPTSTVEDVTPGIQVEQIHPCSLITAEEAEQILGETVAPPQEVNGACAYNNASDLLYIVSVSAVQDEQTEGIMQGQSMLLGLAGVPLDQAKLDFLRSLAMKRDYLAFYTELVNLAQDRPSVKARLLEGIPDLEYWVWLEADSRRQGSLVLVRNQTMLNINLIVPDSRSEAEMLEASQDLAENIYRRLPSRFSITSISTATPTDFPTPSSWTPTITMTPWIPTLNPTPWVSITAASPGYFEQHSYTGDCKQRPTNSVCLGYDDGYVWLTYSDSVLGWGKAGFWQGKSVQVVYGQFADYYHVLETNLVMLIKK